MARPVIACVDDSELSEGVVRVARRLAERLDLEIVLLHVAPPTEAPGVSAASRGQERLHEEELRDAEKLLDDVARKAGLGDDARRRSEIGPAADRIVVACGDEQAELVVLGSHGRGGLKAALLGSVSTTVAARAPCPCVIVTEDSARRPFLD
jgi:nucleotide-binding universal stress UspA family protein